MNSTLTLTIKMLLLTVILVFSLSSHAANLQFNKNVKENQHKNVIQAIQFALIDAGYDPGLADGYTGPRTSAALKSFQRDHDLKITGKPDKSVLKAIHNSLASDD